MLPLRAVFAGSKTVRGKDISVSYASNNPQALWVSTYILKKRYSP